MRTITAPDASEHTVRIEWIGNRMRRAPAQLRARIRKLGDTADVPDVGCVDDFEGIAFAIVAVIVIVLLVVFVLPIAWGLVELLLIVVLAALVWVFRVLFRRPWSVVHRRGDEVVTTWRVVGWREAHRIMVEAAESVERTGTPEVTPPVSGWV